MVVVCRISVVDGGGAADRGRHHEMRYQWGETCIWRAAEGGKGCVEEGAERGGDSRERGGTVEPERSVTRHMQHTAERLELELCVASSACMNADTGHVCEMMFEIRSKTRKNRARVRSEMEATSHSDHPRDNKTSSSSRKKSSK